MVVSPFPFNGPVQQPFKPLWSCLLLHDRETSQAPFAVCSKDSWRDTVNMKESYIKSRRKGTSYTHKMKEDKVIGHILHRICLHSLFKERQKGRENNEEDINCYWKTLTL